MKPKKYTSYAKIELELEIFELELELNLKRILVDVEKTKENLLPQNLIKSFFGNYKSILPNYFGVILKIAIPIIINWITKRKRGN